MLSKYPRIRLGVYLASLVAGVAGLVVAALGLPDLGTALGSAAALLVGATAAGNVDLDA